MAASRIYSFGQDNSRTFAQDLIEYVLKDFGHIWIAERTDRQRRLRAVSMYAFTPEIGKVVTYFSIKHGRFIVTASYDTWNYIKFHRDCVRGELLTNAILNLCKRCKLEDDDLGLFIFMAIAAEYARCAMVDKLEHLVDNVINAITSCMTYIIPGGFVETLDRMQDRASSFEMSEISTDADFDFESSFKSPFTTNSATPTSEFESPLNLSFDFRLCNPRKEIEDQLKKRELHRELFKCEMEYRNYPQNDTDDNAPAASDMGSILFSYQELNVEVIAEEMERESSSYHHAEGGQTKRKLQDSPVQTENRKCEILGNVQLDEFEELKCENLENVKEKPSLDNIRPPGDSGDVDDLPVSDLDSVQIKTQELNIGVNAEGMEHESSRFNLSEGVQATDKLQDASVLTENRKSDVKIQANEFERLKCQTLKDVKENPLVDILSPPEDSGAEVSETCAKAFVVCEETDKGSEKSEDNNQLEEIQIVSEENLTTESDEEINTLEDFSGKDTKIGSCELNEP